MIIKKTKADFEELAKSTISSIVSWKVFKQLKTNFTEDYIILTVENAEDISVDTLSEMLDVVAKTAEEVFISYDNDVFCEKLATKIKAEVVREIFWRGNFVYIEYYEQKCSPAEEAKIVAQDVINLVNSFSCDKKVFAETVANSHRTLQQSFVSLMVETMKRLSENGTDMRNENAVAFAKEVSNLAEEHCFPLI